MTYSVVADDVRFSGGGKAYLDYRDGREAGVQRAQEIREYQKLFNDVSSTAQNGHTAPTFSLRTEPAACLSCAP